MRLLFALLLIANLGWFFGIGSPEPSNKQANSTVAVSTPQLVRIAELSPKEQPGPRTVVSPAMVPDEINLIPDPEPEIPEALPSATCVRLEGFADAKAMAELRERLEAAQVRVIKMGETSFERRRYWVVLPKFRSRQDAQPVMARLRRAGITDLYFIPEGENKNTLSLGLFTTKEAAKRRADEVAPLKLKVHIEEVVSEGKRFYLDMIWREGAEGLDDLTGHLERHELPKASCLSPE